MGERAVAQVKHVVILLAAGLSLAAAVSLYLNLQQLNRQYEELARFVGRTTSQTVAAMREWNTANHGVYVPKSGGLESNQYLEDPLRDITSTQGIELTKINHAQMTRMISELLVDERGIRVHLTSTHPLRPQNSPDAWERAALERFTTHSTEISQVQDDQTGRETFRYMASLKAEKSCMSCHLEHKSSEEIRGGISVSFSYAPFRTVLSRSKRQLWLLHVAGLGAALVPLWLMGRKLIRNVNELQASLRRVSQLEGLVPICASCKRIRPKGADAQLQASWVPVEVFIQDRTAAEFTHGLCPDCREKLYPGIKIGSRSA